MAELFDCLAGRTRFRHFCAVSNCICGGLEEDSDVMSDEFVKPTVPDKCVKFRNPRLNVLEKFDPKPPEAIFRVFFRDDFRPDVFSDVISFLAVDQVGMDVRIKFGDSRSNRSRDIRASLSA